MGAYSRTHCWVVKKKPRWQTIPPGRTPISYISVIFGDSREVCQGRSDHEGEAPEGGAGSHPSERVEPEWSEHVCRRFPPIAWFCLLGCRGVARWQPKSVLNGGRGWWGVNPPPIGVQFFRCFSGFRCFFYYFFEFFEKLRSGHCFGCAVMCLVWKSANGRPRYAPFYIARKFGS